MQSSSSAAAALWSDVVPDQARSQADSESTQGCFRGSARPYRVRSCDPLAAGELGRSLKVAPALAQILMHRGFADEPSAREFLSCKLAGLTQPDGMLDRALAADRLVSAIRRRERIAVFGDYDVDGTTSAVILAGILEQLGGQVSVTVGNRWLGGYGLSDAALERVLATRPSLLVTCDCGSSDHERIAEARRRGVDVIVVDHHLVPAQPLPALAFLNPHRSECGFGYKGLASAGLVLSLGAAVRAALRSNLDLRAWLDLVALGTIADVAPLDGDNRRLVRAGLQRLAADDVRPGIAALRELAKLRRGPLSAVDVAFRMTPRLNAAGRMADPDLTVSLLRARDIYEARQIAARIEQCNDDRKATEKRVTEQAIAQVIEIYGEAPSCGVVVAGDDFHRGVVGITAARIVDRFGVPAIVIGFEGDVGHGSARTSAGFPLYRAIAQCSDSLLRFGGHDAAAGMSIERHKLQTFRDQFSAASGRGDQAGLPDHIVDVTLDAEQFSLPNAADLTQLEPLGAANAEPLFLVQQARVIEVGNVNGAHLKLELRVGSRSFRAFGYDMAAVPLQVGDDVRALGNLRPDTWLGGDRVELRLIEVEAH
ncbi:MAG TPA: single-stranded-DNA-specific exonuclease RecJ [Polyangiales bacterium]|nr:single-stranded-DNA-specific exonuclease RecJ [Polyangiales bacterium]